MNDFRSEYRPPYLAAAIATVSVWLLYFITLAPTTAFWDTSEYIATAHILGVPHPPGNPTFVVLARAWELVLAPFGLSVAERINLFSATMGALAHGCWFLVFHRIVATFTPEKRIRLLGAGLAVLVSATAFTVWSQSNVNEKVYTVSLFTIALLSWLAFHWRDNLGRGKDDNLILLMIFILALSVGNHLMAFLAAPALLVFILLVESKTLTPWNPWTFALALIGLLIAVLVILAMPLAPLWAGVLVLTLVAVFAAFGNWKLYLFGAAVALVGLSIHLFLPLRAALAPVINEADPSTWTALGESLARTQYDKPSVFSDPTDPSLPRGASLIFAQIGNYLQYFDWQWARSVDGMQSLFGGARGPADLLTGRSLRPVLTLVFSALGVYGAYEHFHRARISFWYVAILFATVSFGLVGYLNFRYGYTFPQPGGGYDLELHEVRERDYFFIVSFSLWGLWSGLGLLVLWQRLSHAMAESFAALRTPRARRLAASPILALAFLPLLLNWTHADRSDDYAARDWAYNMLMSVEPYGVLFTNGDNDTFPLWYLQEVEGIRRDVTVIVMSYLNTPWYGKQLVQLTTPCPEGVNPLEDPTRIRCQRPFQPEREAEIYARPPAPSDRPGQPLEGVAPGPAWSPPTRPIMSMSLARIDSIPQIYAANPYNFLLENPVRIKADQLEFTVPGNRVLLPADVFLLNIIQTSLGDRPIYFATTTQAYDRIGLRGNLLRQGVALKLVNGVIHPDAEQGIIALPENLQVAGGYIDLPRTDTLLWDVFVHRGGIPDEWEFWPEPSTTNIPWYYLYAHYAAYAAHSMQGQEEQAAGHLERFEAWRQLAER
ncbi:MAG TPA: DUF2723 domain-containing protein [Longimicrobiales bacterium]|nr:DUF2723 domain-containing protein [Longimicrobiales bacterium]